MSPAHNHLGTVVYWQPFPAAAPVKDVQDRLAVLGLDPKLARDPRERNSFIRAVRAAEEERLVRRVGEETPEVLAFQFTREFLDRERLDYRYEAKVVFDKNSGTVACDDSGILGLVQQRLGYAAAHFLPRDLTAIVQRVFRKEADLLPLRAGGAVYFVPEKYDAAVKAVSDFVAAFGSAMGAIVVPKGDEPSRKTVYAAFIEDAADNARKLDAEVEELVKVLAAGGSEHRRIECRLARAKKMLARCEVYEDTLNETAVGVREAIAAVRRKLEEAFSK